MHFPACYVEIMDNISPLPYRGRMGEGFDTSDKSRRRAPFYLAAEEWIARNLPEDNYLFTWQTDRTVVMGRNQVAHQEVNLDFCRKHDIDVIRRKSGGGAIFSDEGNIMISLITPDGDVENLFREYAEAEAEAVRQLGACVEVHGRNDVILMGKGKICGNAFYRLSNRNIVHGTMLYDTDPELMQGALHSNPIKLHAKGVQSIRARVGVLKGELTGGDVRWLREKLHEALTNRTVQIDGGAIKEIEAIEQSYYKDEFLYGSSARDEEVIQGRVEGCGTIELHFKLKGSMVRGVSVSGDFFELADVQGVFNDTFVGVTFTRGALINAIKREHPECAIRNLSTESLCNIINNQLSIN